MDKASASGHSKDNIPKKRADKVEVSSPSEKSAPSISGTNASSETSKKKRASILSNNNAGAPSTSSRANGDRSHESDIENEPSTPSQNKRGKRAPDGSADKKDPKQPQSVKRLKSEVVNGNVPDSPSAINGNLTPRRTNRGESVQSDASETPSETRQAIIDRKRAFLVRPRAFSKESIRRMTTPTFNMMMPKKVLIGVMLDEEVETRKDETPEQLIEQVMREVKAAKGQGEWKYDYVVSSTCRKRKKLVVKGCGYPLSNMMDVRKSFHPTIHQEPFYSYWERENTMDLLENVVIAEFGNDKNAKRRFLEKYPYRFSPDEEGVTDSQFITNPITKFLDVLRSIEWRICEEAKSVNQPEILFTDWTGTTDNDFLPRFKFTHMLMPSKKVQRAMNKSNEFGAIHCKKLCSESTQPCDSALLNPSNKENLTCACKIEKAGRDRRTIDMSPVECTDQCKCNMKNCGNRVIQYGRQHRVQVWKDWRKGWTLRSLSNKIKKGEFFGEYTGEVLTNYESLQRDNTMYFMEMPNHREIEDPEEKGGQTMHQKLVIDAKEFGNETRFISHSCDPNLRLVNAYVERVGGWFSRMAFIAKRDIEFGEELTFDYFPHVKKEASDTNVNEIFDKCFCGTEKCKFKCKADFDKVREDRAKVRAEQKKDAVEEGDSWDEQSDHETAEQRAEKLKKQLISRRQRNDNRNSMKIKSEEEKELARALEESAAENERGEEEESSDDEEEEQSSDDEEERAAFQRELDATSDEDESEQGDRIQVIVID